MGDECPRRKVKERRLSQKADRRASFPIKGDDMVFHPDAESWLFLPDELFMEVLSFSDVKFLMQMRCVCKSWKSLISDPNFVKLHVKRSARNRHLTLYLKRYNYEKFSDDHCAVPFSVSRLIENPAVISLPNDPYYRLKDYDCKYVVGSCNGLLCLQGFSFTNGYEMWLRFWNPATRTISKKLGSCRVDGLVHYSNLKFGYDSSTDIYKVVYFLPETTNVRIFILGDNVWRNIQNSPVPHHLYKMNVVHLSGSFNWLAIRNYNDEDYECKDIDTIEQFVIISLNLGTETHSELLPPRGFQEMPFVIPNLSVLKDCLCFCHDFKQSHFVIWQMKEFRVEESWTQFLKISYHNLQIDNNFNYLNFYVSTIRLSEKNDTLFIENQL